MYIRTQSNLSHHTNSFIIVVVKCTPNSTSPSFTPHRTKALAYFLIIMKKMKKKKVERKKNTRVKFLFIYKFEKAKKNRRKTFLCVFNFSSYSSYVYTYTHTRNISSYNFNLSPHIFFRNDRSATIHLHFLVKYMSFVFI